MFARSSRIIAAMSAVFDKPPLTNRLVPMLQGFDGPLAFAVFLLACAGLLTMYSSGYDHGTRFVDHSRNMVLAGVIMFVVAQVPPQRLMAFAVPLYTVGVALLIGVALFGLTKKGAQALDQRRRRDPAQRDPEDRDAADDGVVVPEARGTVAAAGLPGGRRAARRAGGADRQAAGPGHRHPGAGRGHLRDIFRGPVVEADPAAGADRDHGRRAPDRVRRATVRGRRALAGAARLPAAARSARCSTPPRTRWARASTSSRA